MDAYSRSVAQIELFGLEDGKHVPCGSATGFFYSRGGNLYFITNWHVVTGVDPTTLMPVAAGPLPDVLVVYYKQTVDTSGKPIPAPARNGELSEAIELVCGRKCCVVRTPHTTEC
jgi:hypothetical protein